MSTVELRGLSKRYGDTAAVEPLDLTVADGEFLTLLGPSGCGKTTTLRMVAGFVAPTTGTIRVDHDDITALPPQKRSMGMVFQDYSLFPHLSVEDNIAFALVERGVAAAERRRRVHELLDLIRLPGIAGRYPSELSGGQQQRVALARALAHTPRVLLMDEPFGALDAKLRVAMQDELRAIQRQLRITTLFVTHDQSEAMHMSDRIAVMNQGRIEQLDAPRTLYEKPRTRFVADFVGHINFVQASVIERRGSAMEVDAMGSRCVIDAGSSGSRGVVTLAIRPERLRLGAPDGITAAARSPSSAWDAANRAMESTMATCGSIERIAYLGNVMHTEVRTDAGPTLIVESAAHGMAPGERVSVAFDLVDVAVVGGEA